jgi:ribosomal protein S4
MKSDKFGPLARKAALVEHKKTLENFNRENINFVEAYNAQRNVKRLPERENKDSLKNPLEQFINLSTVKDFSQTERLSKRLSRMGVASRRMAEKMIDQGMVKVDGK